MNIDSTLSAYFDFLKFSLNAEAEIPQSVETIVWHDFREFAKKQSIVGVIFEGMKRLTGIPVNKPTDDDIMEWMQLTNKIEARNKVMNKKSALVVRNFRREGFRSCIIKGQGNALMYPNPYCRQPGDIDVWVEGKDKDVIAYVRNLCPRVRALYYHIDFPKVKGVDVEVHYRPTYLNNFRSNSNLQAFFREQGDKQFENIVDLPDDAGQIAVPTPAFNRIYQMAHISNHFFNEGIGLRQLIDYYYVLRQGFTPDEQNADRQTLRRCGLYSVAASVMYVMREVLGLPEEMMIVPSDERRGALLLREILEGGNFGQFDTRYGHNTNASKPVKNIQRLYRDACFALSFPGESLSEPFFRLWHFFWRQKHN